MEIVQQINSDLEKLADSEKSVILARLFKTGKGQYGEGDKFLGITVPRQRIIAKKYFQQITLPEVKELLQGSYHEQRLTALLFLMYKFQKSSPAEKKEIYRFYLENTKQINNWDLVDVTTPQIMGNYLLQYGSEEERKILFWLAKSNNIWERRISVLATFMFIREKQFSDALKIAELLLDDKHDLIHKAVGWMLREVGKKDLSVEERFLQKHYKNMPRTMLRYAIEKFEEKKRKTYLAR